MGPVLPSFLKAAERKARVSGTLALASLVALSCAGPGAPPSEPATAPDAELGGESSSAGTKRIEGELLFPPETPADERASVVLRRGRPGTWPGPTSAWDLASGVLGQADVRPDGSFTLEVPADAGKAFVELQARYLHLIGDDLVVSEELDVDALPERLSLQAAVGSCVRFRFRPQPSTELDPGLLVGRVLALDVSPAPPSQVLGSPTLLPVVIGDDLVAEVGGLSPENWYALRTRSHGPHRFELSPFAPVMLDLRELEPGRTFDLDVPLHDGLVLEGRVLDPERRPVAGAFVSVEWGEESWTSWDHRDADDDGRFRYIGVSPLLRSVHVLSSTGEVTLERDSLPPGRVLEGIEVVVP